MAIAIIPKKSVQTKVKEDELNLLSSVENKGFNKSIRNKKKDKVKSLNKDDKKALMDFIFSKSHYNPLNEKSKNTKQ